MDIRSAKSSSADNAPLKNQELIKANSLKLKKFAWLVLGSAFLVMGALLAVCCVAHKEEQGQEEKAQAVGPDYGVFVSNWNQFASSCPSRFQLLGDRASSSQAVIDSLKKWTAPFVEQPDAELISALGQAQDEIGLTSFHKWEEFRSSHRQKEPLDINAEMEPANLALALNSYLHITKNGKTPDYLIYDTVLTVAKFDSLCVYFESEKNRLHKMGIDERIHSCKGLSTKGSIPALDRLITEN